jgi:dTDP-4-amino-4,6-dideoxygalactose transaminase
VSDFTFPATADAIVQAGGIPILVDVEKNTMNVNREIVENSLDKDMEYVAPVSLFGNPLEEDFYKLKKSGLKIIEDAATNLGTKIGNKFVGSLADVTCFSFHPRKIITTGEGGMITTDDKELADKFRLYKMFGKNNSGFIEKGTNYKISDILSAVGLAQLNKIEKIIKNRINKAKIYHELISKIDFLEVQQPIKNSRHTYQSYVCVFTKVGLRDKIIKKLTQQNIESQIGTYALHCLPYFKKCKKSGSLNNSKFLYKNAISLPLHEELTYDDQQFIYKIIKNNCK